VVSLFADLPLQLADAELRWQPAWLDKVTADQWFSALVTQTPWQQPQVLVHGRKHPVPRLLAWYGDPGVSYRYAGLVHQALAWTPLLTQIRQAVEQAAGQPLNGLLLNYYRDGQDSMGWHSDDEPELGANPLIASLSLGAARRFDLRRRGTSAIEHSLLLPHGSLLVMAGATQHHWQHQVAKTRSQQSPRLNLTFRWVLPPA
jgi:alkylated DNA repair dioxygenase AlkB